MRRKDRLVIFSANNNLDDWRSQEAESSELNVHGAREVID